VANRPSHPLLPDQVEQALLDADALEITIEATPWPMSGAPGPLPGHLCAIPTRFTSAERHDMALLTSDARIERSGAPTRCPIITVQPKDTG
jgi:hypothetical protein